MRNRYLLAVLMAALLLAACGTPDPEPTDSPLATSVTVAAGAPTVAPPIAPTNTPPTEATAVPEASPVNSSSPTSEPTATSTSWPPTAAPTIRPPTATPTVRAPTATPPVALVVVRVEPTLTPRPGDDRTPVSTLPIDEPGHYVNVTFGYALHYPPEWYTGFGNRPLLVSFSNLDPGNHNRVSMRAEGCLIEVNAVSNVYGFSFDDLMAQTPRSFPDTERFDLGGEPALRVRASSGDNPFESERVSVQHDGRLFIVSFEYARESAAICRPVWGQMLDNWQWFEPEMAAYRNAEYGYAFYHPRSWYRFNARERGISISSRDPRGFTDLTDLLDGAMLVRTNVIDNAKNLPLDKWLAAQDWVIDAADDIPLEDVRGVRIIREGPSPEIREASGYFQGPQGGIYVVTCLYRTDQEVEFQPIANAIIFSLEF